MTDTSSRGFHPATVADTPPNRAAHCRLLSGSAAAAAGRISMRRRPLIGFGAAFSGTVRRLVAPRRQRDSISARRRRRGVLGEGLAHAGGGEEEVGCGTLAKIDPH